MGLIRKSVFAAVAAVLVEQARKPENQERLRQLARQAASPENQQRVRDFIQSRRQQATRRSA